MYSSVEASVRQKAALPQQGSFPSLVMRPEPSSSIPHHRGRLLREDRTSLVSASFFRLRSSPHLSSFPKILPMATLAVFLRTLAGGTKRKPPGRRRPGGDPLTGGYNEVISRFFDAEGLNLKGGQQLSAFGIDQSAFHSHLLPAIAPILALHPIERRKRFHVVTVLSDAKSSDLAV